MRLCIFQDYGHIEELPIYKLACEEGQDLIEYALIVLFVVLAVTATLINTGSQYAAIYQQIASRIAALLGSG